MSPSPGQPETIASHQGTASYQPIEGIGAVFGHYTLEQKLGDALRRLIRHMELMNKPNDAERW